jgi:aryl-phospho-beta-D-glucosidase BglC (GH1 family)
LSGSRSFAANNARTDAASATTLRSSKLDGQTSHRGVNLAGAEFGTAGQAYGSIWRWPTAQEFSYIASRGFDLVRLPFMWERLQPTLGAELDATHKAHLLDCVAAAKSAGVKVVLDLHNYSAYNGQYFGATPGPTLNQFTDVWLKLSALFRDDDTIIGYGLMNEPKSMPTVGAETGRDRWQTWSQAVLTAIRATGDPTCILVAGYSSSSMGGWLNTTAGHPAPWITDPLDNFAYEAHQYWDSNGGAYSTTYAQELTATSSFGGGDTVQKKFLAELKGWLNWLRTYNVRGYVGEFGWPRIVGVTAQTDSDQWNAMAEQWLRLLDAAGPLVWGATFWASGSLWSSTYALRPYGNDGSGNLATPLENAATLEGHKQFRGVPEVQPKKGFTPIDFGQRWRGQNYDQLLVTTQALLTGNTVFATMVDFSDASRIDQVVVHVTTAASGPTAGQCFVALYDQQTGAQVAISGDLGSLLTSTGNPPMALTAPTRVYRPGERLYAALLFNGTTPPTLGKTGTISTVLSATTKRWGYVSGTATVMPATISPGSLTATTSAFWMAVSGH